MPLNTLMLSWTEATFRGLLESAPDAMVIVDKMGKIVLINSQMEKIFGYSRDELIDQPIEILLPKRYQANHVGQRDQYIRAPRVRPMGAGLDLFGMRKDGSEFPVEISLSPLETDQGFLFMSAIRDITDRKKIELDLKRAREIADSANRAKSEFLANMSHEIRTPLAGILGYVEMLTQYGKSDEARRDYATKIKICADNLTNLINDILDLSKVEAGALKIERLKIPFRTEIDAIISMLQPKADEKGIDLEVAYQGQLPEMIVTDPHRLRQILLNIVGNALKFTEQGSVSLRIKKQDSPIPALTFTVKDTGCGIPETAHHKLFQSFAQADSSTTRKYGGTGLGLVLSRKLAQALKGDLILAESTPGQGSTFVLTLPVQIVSETLVDQNPVAILDMAKTNGDSLPQLKGIHVLLAEDIPENEELITHFLTHAGAKVDSVSDGARAIEKLKSLTPNVIVMDIQMPVLDGYEATKQLRKAGCKIPIIALTAHAMLEEKEKCFEAGVDVYLTKPIDSKLLVRTVYQLAHKKR
jgi:PAS domain S-box-containing protein